MSMVNSNYVDVTKVFHKLWTKAVGTDDYDKKEWVDLEQHIIRLNRLERAVMDSVVT